MTKKPNHQQPQATGAPKKQVRCKHFPNCLNSEEDCPFVHPKETCKYFPACNQGEKCIYLHPDVECKFGLTCSRENCAYKHPKGRQVGGGKMNAGMMNPFMQTMMLMMGQNMAPKMPRSTRGGFKGETPQNQNQ